MSPRDRSRTTHFRTLYCYAYPRMYTPAFRTKSAIAAMRNRLICKQTSLACRCAFRVVVVSRIVFGVGSQNADGVSFFVSG